jgi:hypothetical protein
MKPNQTSFHENRPISTDFVTLAAQMNPPYHSINQNYASTVVIP